MTAPRLSYVLATDALPTVEPVLAALERQGRAGEVEAVLVSPAPLGSDRAAPALAALREVRCPAPLHLAEARALGVAAATAPVVFLGETHSYPEPELVEHLLAAFEGPWTAVVPALLNANPRTATSWAGFLCDYGAWHGRRPAGEVAEPLVYNAAFRRDALLGLGAELPRALSAIDHDLWPALARAGHRARFEPRARLRHLNVGRPGTFLRERFLCGARLGRHRAEAWRGTRWGWPRRLLYAAGSPLVPLVLAARVRPNFRAAREERLPLGVRPVAVAGLLARAAGEALGYLGAAPASVERAETELELHKVRYAGAAR